eukprot:CAMPEP_0115765178 /NCGR_PEP_ID=MMETSP0272-20121206/102454_1 /TAXON_ID=71861 /ORGANISM="Scrippsiella trochoidea, Strain CCMP3099" /LENGTH=111 /DNA_ID=CAMNT_0003211013 /DNA_START=133 /DNA_END=468 /DNA_ORIENTATION=-
MQRAELQRYPTVPAGSAFKVQHLQGVLGGMPQLRLGRVHEGVAEGNHGPRAPQPSVKKEQQEVLVVTPAHAIIDPRAMVVHVQHTTPARAAMVRPPWPVGVALGAPPLPPF